MLRLEENRMLMKLKMLKKEMTLSLISLICL
nr:MAG TPA: hypothetical protein [Caudoviricetes sp.]